MNLPGGRAPTVTIVIATFNWSGALRCALESVRRQSFRDFEVLVVGDACTDDSAEVVASFCDPRFIWHNLEINHGGQWGPNNFGLDHARGEWIAYLGHDDIWHPDHLSTLLRTVNAGAQAAVAIMIMYGPPQTGVMDIAGVFLADTMTAQDFVPPSGLLHRRDLVTRTGHWSNPATIALPTDCDFLLRIALETPVVSSNELTVFKFNAAARRDSYIKKEVREQQAMLAKIGSGVEFRHGELISALKAFVGGTLHAIAVPDTKLTAPGAIARFNRRFKGLEPRFEPGEVVRPDKVVRFGIDHQNGGYEWHLPETHETDGSFRWSGPAPCAAVDLPVVLDRPVAIRVRLLAFAHRDLFRTLAMRVNEEPAENRVSRNLDGTFDIRCCAEADDASHLRLTFEVARTVRPATVGGGTDNRALGIAVSWIEIGPRSEG